MANTYNFFPTAQSIIKSSLELLRVTDIENPNVPTTAQYTAAVQSLNFMLTGWQADGLQLWARKSTSFALTLGTTSYTCGLGGVIAVPRPLYVYQAWRHDALTGVDVPMEVVGERTYYQTPNKTQQGMPIMLYYDATNIVGTNLGTTETGTVYIWQPADAYAVTNISVFFRYQRPFLDFDGVNDQIDMPQYWLDAVKYGLATRLAPVYGTPMLEYDRINKMAKDLKEVAMGYDDEHTSLFVQPAKR
jgi:hypothetical protein